MVYVHHVTEIIEGAGGLMGGITDLKPLRPRGEPGGTSDRKTRALWREQGQMRRGKEEDGAKINQGVPVWEPSCPVDGACRC